MTIIRDVARRLAKAGYVAIVPDLCPGEGGTSSFPNREAVAKQVEIGCNETIIKDLNGCS